MRNDKQCGRAEQRQEEGLCSSATLHENTKDNQSLHNRKCGMKEAKEGEKTTDEGKQTR